jgi:signal transduction histidine kinase
MSRGLWEQMKPFRPGRGAQLDLGIPVRLYAVAPFAVLLASALIDLADPGERVPARLAVTLTLVVVTALWVLWAVVVRPSWPEQRVPISVYYVGLVLLIGALESQSPAFTGMVVVCYAHALALLPTRWLVLGMGATAVVSAVATGIVGHQHPATYMFAVSLAIPLLFAGWFVSVLSGRQDRTIEQLEETNQRLITATKENTGLQSQLLAQAREAGVFDERQRMAREIHDTLAQGLAGVLTQLEALEREGAGDVPEDWHDRVSRARELTRENLVEARRSVQALQPGRLADSQLPEAVASMARTWAAGTEVTASVDVVGDVERLPSELEVTLYRVAQESLTNIAKHAEAANVHLTLSYLDDVVLLDVVDDGVGFARRAGDARPADGSGFGLTGMQQRVELVGGRLEIDSVVGEGTTVNATVPIPAGPEAAGAPVRGTP